MAAMLHCQIYRWPPQTYIINILWLQEKGTLKYLLGSPAKKPSPEPYHNEPFHSQTLHSYNLLQTSLKVPGRWEIGVAVTGLQPRRT
jgi:hypothetical protein